jgi:hypothetical protein
LAELDVRIVIFGCRRDGLFYHGIRRIGGYYVGEEGRELAGYEAMAAAEVEE